MDKAPPPGMAIQSANELGISGLTPCKPLYATRLIGQEVWKAKALLTTTGVSIGYIQRRRRAHIGYAMGYVKEDDARINWDWAVAPPIY